MKKSMILTGLILSLVFLVGCGTTSLMERSRTISVQGMGRVSVEPDVASFTLTVSELAESTSEAQQMTNRKMGVLLEMIRTFGIQDSDIATTALSFSPEYRWKENQQVLVGQRVRQSLHVTVREIKEEAGVLSSLIDEIGTVSNITIGSIQFSKVDTSAEYALSRTLAMEKAIEKAGDYARAAGMQLGKALSVSDYTSQDYQTAVRSTAMKADAMMMAESYAPTELPAGELLITSSVSVVFELR